MCERAHLARIFLHDVVERIEALDLAGEAHGKGCGVELCDWARAASARYQPSPCCLNIVAERRDQTNTRDNNPTFHKLMLHTHLSGLQRPPLTVDIALGSGGVGSISAGPQILDNR